MGICQARKSPNQKEVYQQKLNATFSNTGEALQNQKDSNQLTPEQGNTINQTTQRKLRKSGTLTQFDNQKRMSMLDTNLRNQQKKVPTQPQLKIKLTESFASKDYSVYTGQVKLRGKQNCKVMQHNSDGRLVILETIKYDKDGKDYIDWLEKTDLSFYMIAKVHEIFMNGKQIQIIYEYCNGGTLSELLKFNLSEHVVANMLEQMLDILKFLHKNKLSHNQLTIDSFSFYYDLQNYLVKLTDLRSLHKIQPEETIDIVQYSSPEFLSSKQPHRQNDIWSVAMIAYQLLTKQFVYSEETEFSNVIEVKRAITKWVGRQRIDCDISNDFGCLLLQMLKINSHERFTSEQCLNHSFFKHHFQSNIKCIYPYVFSNDLEDLQKWLLKYHIDNYEHLHKDVVYRIFTILDQDKDGKLNEKEIQEFQRRLKQEPHQENNIKILDTYIEKNCEIEFEEFMFLVCNKSIYFTPQHIQHSFKKLCNKNGEITIKSLSRLLNIDEEKITKEFIKHHLFEDQYCLPLDMQLYEQVMNQFQVVSKVQ